MNGTTGFVAVPRVPTVPPINVCLIRCDETYLVRALYSKGVRIWHWNTRYGPSSWLQTFGHKCVNLFQRLFQRLFLVGTRGNEQTRSTIHLVERVRRWRRLRP